MTIEQWQRDIDVNLTGAFRTIQACLPGMRERRYGRIVVIVRASPPSAACRGRSPTPPRRPASSGWCARSPRENAAFGITANAILPGLVATEQVLAMPAAIRERVLAALPTGRPVEPAEDRRARRVPGGEEAAQITGQAIAIDGGAGLNAMSLGNER